MAARVSEQDKVRARHHLGYVNVEAGQSFNIGIPQGFRTEFMIEGALDRILPQALPLFLKTLDRLDCIECELFGSLDYASITSIADIVVRPDRLKELSGYYNIARGALANLLAITPNPYEQRQWVMGQRVNIPVY